MIDDLVSGGSLRVGLATLLLACLISVYIQQQRQHKTEALFGEQHGCLPIEMQLPYKWPLALDLFKRQYGALFQGNLFPFQAEYFERTNVGHKFQVKLLGRTLTSESPLLDLNLGSRRAGLFLMIGEGIFTQDGNPWRHSGELLRRQFMRIQYQDVKIFDEPINTLLANLASSTDVVDLQPEFFRFTLATTASLIFGEPFAGLDSEDHEAFSRNFDYGSLVSAMRLRLADLCFLYTPSKYKKACAMVKGYAMKYVNQALKDMRENGEEAAFDHHPFILDLYRELQDPILVPRSTHERLDCRTRHHSLPHVLGVLPVSAPSARPHPSTSGDQSYSSIRPASDTQPDKQDVIPQMRAKRELYTNIPINIREATRTTILPRGGGPDGHSPLLIRKGLGVGFSPYNMHRSTALYGPDAHAFRPERWEGPELKNVGSGFLPFHGGPRVCLGKDFALTEASYGIVRILQTYPKVRLAPGCEVRPSGQEKQIVTFVVASAEGCKVLLE